MSKLVEIAQHVFESEDEGNVHFVKEKKYNDMLNDIEKHPHIYLLACLMDKQIKAERAWEIPCKVCEILGNYEIEFLASKPESLYIDIFKKNKLHRFNEEEARYFYKAIQKIVNQYDGDASKIWKGCPSSATVVYRFLEFEGIGIKIATMAANILARQFKIKFSDYYSIDISPDVHVRRILKRLGYLSEKPSTEQVIYKAREINPEFPGLIDYSCWKIGRTYCHQKNPNCEDCPLKNECKTYITNKQNII